MKNPLTKIKQILKPKKKCRTTTITAPTTLAALLKLLPPEALPCIFQDTPRIRITICEEQDDIPELQCICSDGNPYPLRKCTTRKIRIADKTYTFTTI